MTVSDPGTPDRSSPPPARGPATTRLPRTSRLALAAFILGLAGVCPPLGFAAMMLGFIAYFRITRSAGGLKGRGYALWALGLGAATTIIWIEVWDRSGTWAMELWESRLETEIREGFAAALANEPDAIRATMEIEPGEHQAGIERFIEAVRDGGLEPWAISIQGFESIDSSFARPLMQANIRIDATDQTIWTGVARFILEPPVQASFDDLDSFLAHPALRSFKFIGPEGRALRLPKPSGMTESSISNPDDDHSAAPVTTD